jgi:hypothetical protein
MKKVTIYTIADKRPDFIPVQYETFKKFIKDDYEYVVVDNAIDSKKRSRAIEKTCKNLGVRYLKVRVDRGLMKESGQVATTLIGTYKNGSIGAGYAFNFVWKQICNENQGKIFVLIDSDMFLTRPISWNEELGEKDAAFVYQYRGIEEDGNNPKVVYPWNALCIFNPDKIPNLKEMNWNSGVSKRDYIEGYAVDTAGYIHYWMKENKINVRHISEYAIHNWKKKGDTVWIDAVLNGNFHYSFEYSLASRAYSNFQVNNSGWQKFTAEKILPHFPENFDKILILKTIKYFEKFLLGKQTYPDPSFIGFLEFETFNENIDPVTIHSKAGSGYMGFDQKYATEKLDFIEKTLRIDQIRIKEWRIKLGIDKIMPLSLIKDYKRVYKLFLRKIKHDRN